MNDFSTTPRIAASLGAGALVLMVLSGCAGMGGVDNETDRGAAGSSLGPDEVRVVPLLNLTESHETAEVLGASSNGCVFDPRYLPHTPDAVEGWYRSCASLAKRVRCHLDQEYLPHTPDAIEGWYRGCS